MGTSRSDGERTEEMFPFLTMTNLCVGCFGLSVFFGTRITKYARSIERNCASRYLCRECTYFVELNKLGQHMANLPVLH